MYCYNDGIVVKVYSMVDFDSRLLRAFVVDYASMGGLN